MCSSKESKTTVKYLKVLSSWTPISSWHMERFSLFTTLSNKSLRNTSSSRMTSTRYSDQKRQTILRRPACKRMSLLTYVFFWRMARSSLSIKENMRSRSTATKTMRMNALRRGKTMQTRKKTIIKLTPHWKSMFEAKSFSLIKTGMITSGLSC